MALPKENQQQHKLEKLMHPHYDFQKKICYAEMEGGYFKVIKNTKKLDNLNKIKMFIIIIITYLLNSIIC